MGTMTLYDLFQINMEWEADTLLNLRFGDENNTHCMSTTPKDAGYFASEKWKEVKVLRFRGNTVIINKRC